MKLVLVTAVLASALFCGWAGPIDADNVIRPALSLDQLKGIRRMLRVDPAVTVTDWECTTCKIITTVLQDLFLKNATEDEIVAIITAFCIDLKIEDELVCTAVVIEFKVIRLVGRYSVLAGCRLPFLLSAWCCIASCNCHNYAVYIRHLRRFSAL